MPTNDGGHVIALFTEGTATDEMNALDQLGPLARQVIYDSPIRYSAGAVLKQLRDYEESERQKLPPEIRHLVHLNPRDPKIDAAIAKGLVDDSIKTMLKDRSEQDAMLGVKPLVPKIGVKTMREQRRLRKVRW
jgi:hypothetical protein